MPTGGQTKRRSRFNFLCRAATSRPANDVSANSPRYNRMAKVLVDTCPRQSESSNTQLHNCSNSKMKQSSLGLTMQPPPKTEICA
jgi:hypothetical protein